MRIQKVSIPRMLTVRPSLVGISEVPDKPTLPSNCKWTSNPWRIQPVSPQRPILECAGNNGLCLEFDNCAVFFFWNMSSFFQMFPRLTCCLGQFCQVIDVLFPKLYTELSMLAVDAAVFQSKLKSLSTSVALCYRSHIVPWCLKKAKLICHAFPRQTAPRDNSPDPGTSTDNPGAPVVRTFAVCSTWSKI